MNRNAGLRIEECVVQNHPLKREANDWKFMHEDEGRMDKDD